jgi:cytosine/adenosine deaminase-related metal-dependent hydrolase
MIATPGGSTGRALFDGAIAGGAAALGAKTGLAAGAPADFVSLRARHDIALTGDRLLDALVFSGGVFPDTVWVAGKKLVENGRHAAHEATAARFAKAMRELAA